jgi:hypothetical protein
MNEKKGRGAESGYDTCHVAYPHLLRPYPYHPFDAVAKYRQDTEHEYFALNIFSEFSLIFSTTLKVFPAACSDLPVERKPHVSIFK